MARTFDSGWVGLGLPTGAFDHWNHHSTAFDAAHAYANYFPDIDGDGRADWIQVSRVHNSGWSRLAL